MDARQMESRGTSSRAIHDRIAVIVICLVATTGLLTWRVFARDYADLVTRFYFTLGLLGTAAALGGVSRSLLARRDMAQHRDEAIAERYRRIVEATHDGIWMLDAQAKTTYVNQRLCEMLGYTEEEILGRSLFDFLDITGRRIAMRQFEERRCGMEGDYELGLRRKDGSTLWGLISSTPLLNDMREFVGDLGLIRDITHRQRAEETLRNVITQARCILWSAAIEKTGDKLDWRLDIPEVEAAQHVLPLDLRPGQAYAEAWEESRDPNDHLYLDRVRYAALDKGKRTYCHEYRCRDRNGDVRWLHEDVSIRRVGEGRWEAVGVCTDITDRKHLEQQLEQQVLHDAARLKALLQLNRLSGPSSEELLQYALDQAVELTGSSIGFVAHVTPDDALWLDRTSGEAMRVRVQPTSQSTLRLEDLGRFGDALGQCQAVIINNPADVRPTPTFMAGEAVILTRLLSVPIFDGLRVVALVGMANKPGDYHEEDGIQIGLMIEGALRILERRQMEAQILHNRKLESVGQLAAGIAHEINTPTQFVGDNLRFLQDSFADLKVLLGSYKDLLSAAVENRISPTLLDAVSVAEEKAELDYLLDEIPTALTQSLEGTQRVSAIVRAMKEFSHPDRPGKTPTDINRAIENTINVARNEWKYVADVETEFCPDLPLITCLPGELNQVFLNLIVNSAHAIQESMHEDAALMKGTIRISTRVDEDWVQIDVADNGAGIPLAIQSRVFDPFFTTKEVGKGTGQGLTIAYNVVVGKHQGSISFESSPGQGTTFHVRLPICYGPV